MNAPKTIDAARIRNSDDERIVEPLVKLLELAQTSGNQRAMELALAFENGSMTEINCEKIDAAVAEIEAQHRKPIEAALQEIRSALAFLDEDEALMEGDEVDVAKIRELNDRLRKFGDFTLGTILIAHGVQALEFHEQQALFQLVREFDEFNEGLDPHGEHQAGEVIYKGVRYWFWIDYLDANYEYGSENPADPKQCKRVMTIMLPHER